MEAARFLAGILPVLVLAFGQANGSVRASPAPPTVHAATARPPAIGAPHGRYVGWVIRGQQRRFADALLTRDGSVRIHIGGDGAGSGAIPDRWDRSAQFVGRLFVRDGAITGSGRLLGEGCAQLDPIRFCQAPAAAKLKFLAAGSSSPNRLRASMTVLTDAGVEIWRVVLDPWRLYYELSISPRALRGLYSESAAEFAHFGETILDVDAEGRVYFQSPGNGCVGNGTMTPRASVGVVDVRLNIENCAQGFEYLNGFYKGFSTFSQSDYWGYDAILRTWLSKPASADEPAAITMWSIPR